MIEAFEFPPWDAAAAWRSSKLNVDQSPLVFTLRIWLPLTVRTRSLLGQIIGEAIDSGLFVCVGVACGFLQRVLEQAGRCGSGAVTLAFPSRRCSK